MKEGNWEGNAFQPPINMRDRLFSKWETGKGMDSSPRLTYGAGCAGRTDENPP